MQAVSPASGSIVLTTDGAKPNGSNCIVLPSGTAATFNAILVAREPDTGQAASFSIAGGLFTRGSSLAASSYAGPGSTGIAATYMSGSDAAKLVVNVGFNRSIGARWPR